MQFNRSPHFDAIYLKTYDKTTVNLIQLTSTLYGGTRIMDALLLNYSTVRSIYQSHNRQICHLNNEIDLNDCAISLRGNR